MHQTLQKADPATFEIIKNSFYKIAEEMRVVLAKTAYSPLLNSRRNGCARAGSANPSRFDARCGPSCGGGLRIRCA